MSEPTVLLVDDDASTRASLEATLEQAGFAVASAADARSARERIASTHPIAAVLDVVLPDGNAFELLTELREREETREMPVLLLSGSRLDEAAAVRALDHGAADFLRRPFGGAEFLARLQAALRTRAALAEARRLGRIDELTSLANRRGFFEALERERKRANREGTMLAVVAVDVDRFKDVNDTWGHAAGDRVLEAIGALLRRRVRASDVAARTGGEEFALVLPSTSHAGAMELAETLRHELESLRIACPEATSIGVTASFGVASARGEVLAEAADAEELLRTADRALYRAKRQGRNRVEASQ